MEATASRQRPRNPTGFSRLNPTILFRGGAGDDHPEELYCDWRTDGRLNDSRRPRPRRRSSAAGGRSQRVDEYSSVGDDRMRGQSAVRGWSAVHALSEANTSRLHCIYRLSVSCRSTLYMFIYTSLFTKVGGNTTNKLQIVFIIKSHRSTVKNTKKTLKKKKVKHLLYSVNTEL